MNELNPSNKEIKAVENSNTIYYIILTEVLTALKSQKPARSKWDRAVMEDAEEMISEAIDNLRDNPEEAPRDLTSLTAELLNVSINTLRSWGGDDGHNGIRDLYKCAHESSWGGSHLCYDYDIARHYCTPSELKRTRDGERRPNAHEEWLDVQARAIYQALSKIRHLWSMEAGKNRIRIR